MVWQALLPLGFNLLGSMFGGNKTSASKSESSTSKQIGTTTQVTGQEGSSKSTDVSSQMGSTSNLDDATLANLTQSVNSLMSSASGNRGIIDAELNKVAGGDSGFDAAGYIDSITAAARGDVNEQLESDTNQLYGAVGATGGSNSAVALLKDKMKRRGALQVAGVTAEAGARATELEQTGQRNRTDQLLSMVNSGESAFGNQLNALLGARSEQVTSGTQSGTTDSKQQTNQAGGQTQSSTTNGTLNADEEEGTPWGNFFKSLGSIKFEGF